MKKIYHILLFLAMVSACQKTEYNAPVVDIFDIYSVSENSAICKSEVLTDNNSIVYQRGVCWSTEPEPDCFDSYTEDGSGEGNFKSVIADLESGTIYYVRAYAINNYGTSYSPELIFTTKELSVGLPVVTTDPVTVVFSFTDTFICGGDAISDGNSMITRKGLCWSTEHEPTVEDNANDKGGGLGPFDHSFYGLEHGTTYYVRAYATNAVGTAYGQERSFTTKVVKAPTVATVSIGNITSSSARCTANVTDDGNRNIYSKGVCWSTSENPTTDGSHIDKGYGKGEFVCDITDLEPLTTYYVRAFATNSEGTSYGEQLSFTTLEETKKLTLEDFLGTYTATGYNLDLTQERTWDNVNIKRYDESLFGTNTIIVEGLDSGKTWRNALGKFDEEKGVIILYNSWGSSSFHFNEHPEIPYRAFFYCIYTEDNRTFYYLQNPSSNTYAEAWLTRNEDGSLVFGPSDTPDKNGRYANAFIFYYEAMNDSSKYGYWQCCRNVILRKDDSQAIGTSSVKEDNRKEREIMEYRNTAGTAKRHE